MSSEEIHVVAFLTPVPGKEARVSREPQSYYTDSILIGTLSSSRKSSANLQTSSRPTSPVLYAHYTTVIDSVVTN